MATAPLNASDLLKEYCLQLELLGQFVARSGFDVVPYKLDALAGLALQPLDQIAANLEDLKKTNSLYMSSIEKEQDDYSDRQMAWAALRTLGMRPLGDAFSLITDQDAIEVYNADHQQLFRSFNIFKCLSYTLDEMRRNAWWELFERDDSVTAHMFQVANQVLAQKEPATILQPFGTHWVQEKFSSRMNRALLESRLLTPLLATSGSRQIVGYMNVFRIVKLESMAVTPPSDS